jgi:hypothetical protein
VLLSIPLTAADAAASSKTSLELYGEPYHAKTSYAQAYHGIAADYGLCDIDVRQIVHVSGIYELPFGFPQFVRPSSSIDQRDARQSNDPRELQFSLKYYF